jgi:hypothetical protein
MTVNARFVFKIGRERHSRKSIMAAACILPSADEARVAQLGWDAKAWAPRLRRTAGQLSAQCANPKH